MMLTSMYVVALFCQSCCCWTTMTSASAIAADINNSDEQNGSTSSSKVVTTATIGDSNNKWAEIQAKLDKLYANVDLDSPCCPPSSHELAFRRMVQKEGFFVRNINKKNHKSKDKIFSRDGDGKQTTSLRNSCCDNKQHQVMVRMLRERRERLPPPLPPPILSSSTTMTSSSDAKETTLTSRAMTHHRIRSSSSAGTGPSGSLFGRLYVGSSSNDEMDLLGASQNSGQIMLGMPKTANVIVSLPYRNPDSNGRCPPGQLVDYKGDCVSLIRTFSID